MKELVVVKVGSNSLLDDGGSLEQGQFQSIADQMAALEEEYDFALVTSGAVSAGMDEKGIKRPGPEDEQYDVPSLQYFAAIGQPLLMERWREAFRPYAKAVGQCLITNYELKQPQEEGPFIGTVSRTILEGDVPVINENDAVAADEIRVGDNDRPAAMITIALARTGLWRACSALLLTDVDGLHRNYLSEDEELVSEVVNPIDALGLVRDTKTVHGSGSMRTKIEAAQIVYDSGLDVRLMVANGRTDNVIARSLQGEVGTCFLPKHNT